MNRLAFQVKKGSGSGPGAGVTSINGQAGAIQFISNEVPTMSVGNTVATFANNYVSGTVQLLRGETWSTNYVESAANTITIPALGINETIFVNYQKL